MDRDRMGLSGDTDSSLLSTQKFANPNLTLFDKMFRVKPIRHEPDAIGRRDSTISEGMDAPRGNLPRVLKSWDLISFGISSAVGSGIFVIAGIAGKFAGAALFLSFIIGGVSCIFSGLCYCEFATRIPISGSAYTYAYCSFGELIGFLIGWNLTLEYGISAATVAQGWSSYVHTFLRDIDIPGDYLPSILFGHNINDVLTINIMSGIIIMICTVLIIYGIRESATITNLITIWNVFLILFFIIAGCFWVDTDNWFHPCDNEKYGTKCTPDESNSIFPQGISGVMHASGIVFFSYVGFDAVSSLAEETINPNVTMVNGILGTLFIATSLYVGVSIVLMGMVPFTALDKNSPLSDAFKSHDQTTIATLVAFGALTTTAATTLTSLIGQPRIFYRMAKDGLFYKIFGRVHKKYHTPHWGSLISGIFAAIIGTFINFNLLAEMISVGTLMAYTLVCAGVIILRYPMDEDATLRKKSNKTNGNKYNQRNSNKYDTRHSRQHAGFSDPLHDSLDSGITDDSAEFRANAGYRGGGMYNTGNTTNVTYVVSIYTVCCLVLGFGIDLTDKFDFNDISIPFVIVLVFGVIVLGMFVYICSFDCNLISYKPKDIFLCPWCPFLPCLGIFVNSYMIASLKWESFLRVFVWFIIGTILYITYGSKHSKLNYDFEAIIRESIEEKRKIADGLMSPQDGKPVQNL